MSSFQGPMTLKGFIKWSPSDNRVLRLRPDGFSNWESRIIKTMERLGLPLYRLQGPPMRPTTRAQKIRAATEEAIVRHLVVMTMGVDVVGKLARIGCRIEEEQDPKVIFNLVSKNYRRWSKEAEDKSQNIQKRRILKRKIEIQREELATMEKRLRQL